MLFELHAFHIADNWCIGVTVLVNFDNLASIVLSSSSLIKMKLALKYTLFGMKIRNIEYVQTFTVHVLITYLEKKMLAIKMAIYQKKLLVFI